MEACESSRFIALAWRELLDRRTPNSYRPKLLDTHGLVEELHELADLSLENPRWQRHIQLVQAELQNAAKSEGFWLQDNPWAGHLIRRLATTQHASELKDLAAVFNTASPNAVERLVESLYEACSKLPKKKHAALNVLQLLGTHAIRLGIPPPTLDQTVDLARGTSPQAVVECIHTMLRVRDRPFTCIMSLSGDPRHIQSVFASSRLRRTRMKDFPVDDVGQSFKKASMDETPYFLRLKATSHLSAAAEAMAQCRRIVDVFNLFQNRASIKVRPTVLVFDAERSVTVNHYTEQLLASQPNRAALRLTRATLTETDMEPHLGLQNALEQHSIALATDDPKAGLVGIWTAIECLTGDERRGSPDIGRIRQRIGPIVALRRVERIVRYLASCCHGHYRSQRTQPTEGFRRSTINYLSPRDIFEALRGLGATRKSWVSLRTSPTTHC